MNAGERSAGIVIGKVTAVKDPEQLGRIQVSYPWLDEPETALGAGRLRRWPAATAASSSCPKIDDEVILALRPGRCGTTRTCSASCGTRSRSRRRATSGSA